jgi:hypothetical protein
LESAVKVSLKFNFDVLTNKDCVSIIYRVLKTSFKFMPVITSLKPLHERCLVAALKTPYQHRRGTEEPALLKGIGRQLSFLAAFDSCLSSPGYGQKSALKFVGIGVK